jgi:dTDP-4-amino-4,6-dideoxygalactose transaminase
MTGLRVPFVDLHAQYLAYKEEFDSAISAVIQKTAFISGEFAHAFEQSFANACGVRHCIAVANGTDAIYIVLKMLGIGPGDEVITTAGSWFSTSETIGQTGARPVFVDVDDFYNIDATQIEPKINAKTKAIIPVHLYGQSAEIDEISEIAARNGLALVEDCAQAHLAQRVDARTHKLTGVGTFGVAGTFSFYPGKNLGAYGDAGAIVTNDDAFATRCRMFANHGALVKHHHRIEGINSRMDGIQAALLSKKLPHLSMWTEARRRTAQLYDNLLSGIPEVKIPRIRQGSTHVYHLYVIQCEKRDHLKQWLGDRGIETAVHYPTALPFLEAYSSCGHSKDNFPRAAANQDRILSLPMYAELTPTMVHDVASSIRQFYDSPGR